MIAAQVQKKPAALRTGARPDGGCCLGGLQCGGRFGQQPHGQRRIVFSGPDRLDPLRATAKRAVCGCAMWRKRSIFSSPSTGAPDCEVWRKPPVPYKCTKALSVPSGPQSLSLPNRKQFSFWNQHIASNAAAIRAAAGSRAAGESPPCAALSPAADSQRRSAFPGCG